MQGIDIAAALQRINPMRQQQRAYIAPPRPDARPGPYISPLNPAEDAAFQDWVKVNHVPWYSGEQDYDMPGFWKASISGDPAARTEINPFDSRLHFTDKYKTPFHRTFSNQSKYALPNAPHWQGDRLLTNSGQIITDETPKKRGSLQRATQR